LLSFRTKINVDESTDPEHSGDPGLISEPVNITAEDNFEKFEMNWDQNQPDNYDNEVI
jgi:hypothetical protein